MKYLIVNGDDFGASRGINRGILEALHGGILTSTSLMVDAPWSEEAAALSRTESDLSVGLHVDLDGTPFPGAELDRQLRRFQALMGRLPTHLDSHHNVHRDPRLVPHFLDLAARLGCPVRWHSRVRCLSRFYGQWGGESHPEQVGAECLIRLFDTDVEDGMTELCCHPGYVDPDLRSGYSAEREIELRTLCDPAVREALERRRIHLIGFRDLPADVRT